MKTIHIVLFLAAFLTSTFWLGCATTLKGVRHPSSVSTGDVDATLEGELAADTHLVQAYFQSSSGAAGLGNELRTIVILAGTTQSLASSFDMLLDGLAKLGKTPSPQMINGTALNCELWENSYFNRHTEARVVNVQDLFLAQNSATAYAWFLNRFLPDFGDYPNQIVAKAQIMRLLKEHHDEVCATQNCPPFYDFTDFSAKHNGLFSPLDDQGMLKFEKTFRTKIAKYNLSELLNMPEGACFKQGSSRAPNAVAPYDWKTLSHTGMALPKGQFVVTYDDGPHPQLTELIATEWINSGLPKPTFFWLAQNAARYASVIKFVYDAGFEIESHSYDHPDMGNLAKATSFGSLNGSNRPLFAKEIAGLDDSKFSAWQSDKLDHEIVGATHDIEKYVTAAVGKPYTVTRFRLPYGSGVGNVEIGKRLAQLKVNHYFWAIDSLDWQDHNPASILARIQTQMGMMKRGIILIHDIHKQSYQATQLLLPYFKQNNISVQSLSGGKL